MLYYNVFFKYFFRIWWISWKIWNRKKELPKYYLPLQILNLYIISVSDFLAIIPYFIRKKKLKKKEEKIIDVKTEDKINEDDIPLIYNDNENTEIHKKLKKIILLCILISVLDFLQKFSFILNYIIYPDKDPDIYSFSCVSIFGIVFQFICSYFILKIHFYKLQYLSLFLNIGIFIIILIIDIINLLKYKSFDAKIYYSYALNIIFHSFELSYGKKILLDGYLSIYLLIIIKGVIVLIFIIIFSVIMIFVNRDIYPRIGFFFPI